MSCNRYCGTSTGYRYGGRCGACFEAKRDEKRRYFAARADHGSRLRFDAGCRCPTCTQAELDRCIVEQRAEDHDDRNTSVFRKRLLGRSTRSLHEVLGTRIPYLSGNDIPRLLLDVRPDSDVQRHMVEWYDPTADAALFARSNTPPEGCRRT